MSKKKKKTKIIYRNRPAQREDSKKIKEEVRNEIEILEGKRSAVGKGWRGLLAKAAITKQINEKRGYLSASDKLRTVKQQTELGRALVEKEKVKAEMNAFRKKSQINFGDLYKGL